MYTSAELQLLRNADPGAVLPGIDTPEGNPLPVAALTPASKITQNQSAPYFYDPATNAVVVKQDGAVLSGINFGTASVAIAANNVTVKDCTFQAGPNGWYCVQQYETVSGAVVQQCTFNGGSASDPLRLAAFVSSPTKISVLNNRFINAPGDAVDLENGVVSGNYFSGAGYSSTLEHPDMIWVGATTGPVSITNNFIDATYATGATAFNNGGVNSAVRITAEQGNTSNVSVTGNVLLGGTYTVCPGVNPSAKDPGTFSNINISNNYVGFGLSGAFGPGAGPATTLRGNVIFDYTNPIYSTTAWAAYTASSVRTANHISSTSDGIGATTANLLSAGSAVGPATAHFVSSTGGAIGAPSSGSTTLYGAGYKVLLYGGANENVFVGGAGVQWPVGGAGANIFTYLAISDSMPIYHDGIQNFDSAKDVIDVSRIDANLTAPGVQNFTFIGTAPFSGSGAQLRYQQDPTNNATYVEATLAGNSAPDLYIQLGGLQTLTAANFALTAAQSATDFANGAALTVSRSETTTGGLVYSYSNVRGRAYTSYQALYSGSVNDLADDLNLSSTTNELDLHSPSLTIARGSGAETVTSGTTSYSLAYRPTETINASAAGSETFQLGAGSGNETIKGFNGSGANADTIQFATSAFSYLYPGMTQAQDLAAVLVHASSSSAGLTITDSANDKVTFSGLTASALADSGSNIRFV